MILWISTAGTFDLFRWEISGNFYDAQARAWLDGRWDIGIDVLSIESFFRFSSEAQHLIANGWTSRADLLDVEAFFRSQPAYMYQGPVPAVFRLPFMILAPTLEGRLTSLSILVGTLATGGFAAALLWEIRQRILPEQEVHRSEALATAGFTFLVVGASNLVFLAAKPWVYHEALTWGVALCLGALWAMMRYLAHRSTRRVALLGLFVVAGFLTRPSVALGPLIGVAAMATAEALALYRRRAPRGLPPRKRAVGYLDRMAKFAPSGGTTWLPLVGLVGVIAVALGGYGVVNYIKFRTLFRIPFEWQFISVIDTSRQQFLDVNGGFFALRFVPSTVLQYFRPDAFSLSPLFPWIDFGPSPGTVVGNVRFDLFDRTASVPTTMIAFLALAAAGLFSARRNQRARRLLRPFMFPLASAIVAGLAVLPFGHIANRYLADFLPMAILVGALGLQLLLRSCQLGDVRRPRVLMTAIVLCGLVGFWFNVSHGLLIQRVYSTHNREELTASFIRTQHQLDQHSPLSDGATLARRLLVGSSFPMGQKGDLAVIDDCDALYLNDGASDDAVRQNSWIPVERTEAVGRHLLDIQFADNPVGTRTPLFSARGDEGPALLSAETVEDQTIVFEYAGPGLASRSAPLKIDPSRIYEMTLATDHHIQSLRLTLDDRIVFETYFTHPGPIELGRNVTDFDSDRRFDGLMKRQPLNDAPLCHRLVSEARQMGILAG